MIPKNELPLDNELLDEVLKAEEVGATKTYKMHIDKERIFGFTDDVDALKQAIYKQINTERDIYPIYTNYGVKKRDLFGKPKRYAYMILTERVRDALLSDDRVLDVHSFYYVDEESKRDNLCMSFSVESVYGVVEIKNIFDLV